MAQPLPQPGPQQVRQQPQNVVNQNILPEGVEKPKFGICILCDSDKLEFYDSGDGRCPNCGRTFKWFDKQKTDDTDYTDNTDNTDDVPGGFGLTNEIRLELLEDRFAKGELSMGLYENLRKKLVDKIILELEDKLISGKITEEEFNEKKVKL
jgi:hypothetical protein